MRNNLEEVELVSSTTTLLVGDSALESNTTASAISNNALNLVLNNGDITSRAHVDNLKDEEITVGDVALVGTQELPKLLVESSVSSISWDGDRDSRSCSVEENTVSDEHEVSR